MAYPDLTGRRFGHLTVMERSGSSPSGKRKWLCKCDCGKDTVVTSGSLNSGNTKSCGCGRFYHSPTVIDLTGQRFSRLLVTSRAANHQNGGARWDCTCDCGKEVTVAATHLRRRKIKACGCHSSDTAKRRHCAHRNSESGRANERAIMYRRCAESAKRRNLSFEITMEQFLELATRNCFYCDVAPAQRIPGQVNDSGLRWNGIDRVDNSLGYSLENCVPCCGTCNRAKSVMSYDDFLAWVSSVYNHQHRTRKDGNLLTPDALRWSVQ